MKPHQPVTKSFFRSFIFRQTLFGVFLGYLGLTTSKISGEKEKESIM